MTRLAGWAAFVALGTTVLTQVSFDGTDPAAVSFEALRLAAICAGGYLLVALALGAAVRLTGLRPLVRAADVFTLPAVRRLLNGAVGLSLAAGTLAGPAGASNDNASPLPVMRVLDAPDPLPPPPTPQGAVAAPPPAAAEWVVQPGQCFWSAARSRLVGAGVEHPSDAEIVRYWVRLMEANADRLAVPGNPGLIFTGQTFVLPPIDSAR